MAPLVVDRRDVVRCRKRRFVYHHLRGCRSHRPFDPGQVFDSTPRQRQQAIMNTKPLADPYGPKQLFTGVVFSLAPRGRLGQPSPVWPFPPGGGRLQHPPIRGSIFRWRPPGPIVYINIVMPTTCRAAEACCFVVIRPRPMGRGRNRRSDRPGRARRRPWKGNLSAAGIRGNFNLTPRGGRLLAGHRAFSQLRCGGVKSRPPR